MSNQDQARQFYNYATDHTNSYQYPQPTIRDQSTTLSTLAQVHASSFAGEHNNITHISSPGNQNTLAVDFNIQQQQSLHQQRLQALEKMTSPNAYGQQPPHTGCVDTAPGLALHERAPRYPDANRMFENHTPLHFLSPMSTLQYQQGQNYDVPPSTVNYTGTQMISGGQLAAYNPFEGFEVSCAYDPHAANLPQPLAIYQEMNNFTQVNQEPSFAMPDGFAQGHPTIQPYPHSPKEVSAQPSDDVSGLDSPHTNGAGAEKLLSEIDTAQSAAVAHRQHDIDAPDMLELKPKKKSEGRNPTEVGLDTGLQSPKAKRKGKGQKPTGIEKQPAKPPKAKVTPAKARPKRYTALENALTTAIPDFAQIKIQYATREEAVNDFEASIKDLATYWTPPADDSSIPQTDVQRQAVVRMLLGAMKDTSRAKDNVDSRWTEDAPRKHEDKVLETACWEIVGLAERLHREGPSVLAIHDVNFLKTIKHSENLTFDQRIRFILVLFLESKSRADGMIKGQTLHATVGAPQEALHSARQNGVNNKNKAEQLAFARANRPELTTRKRKRGNTAQIAANVDQLPEGNTLDEPEPISQTAIVEYSEDNSGTSEPRRKRARGSPRPRLSPRPSSPAPHDTLL